MIAGVGQSQMYRLCFIIVFYLDCTLFCIKKQQQQVFLKNKGLPYEQECSLSKDEVEMIDTVAPCARGWVSLLGFACLIQLRRHKASL